MESVKGTRTEQNLLKSFAGESQARNRYAYFSEIAKSEGYEQVAAVFARIAEQEREHAKVFFKYLDGGNLTISATYPAGKISTTIENLLSAAEGEREEWSILYSETASIAQEEGFEAIAESFRQIASVEVEHEKYYRSLLSRFKDGNFFRRDNEIWWQCRNCGYVCRVAEAPIICPACKHKRAYFEPMRDNY